MTRATAAVAALVWVVAVGCETARDGEGLYGRGLELMSKGRYVEARHVFEVLVEQSPDGGEADAARLKIARILHLYEARPADALAHYDALIEKGGPQALDAYDAVGDIYRYHYRDLAGALRVYQEIIDRYDGRANVEPYYLAIAEIHETEGRYAEARAAYTRFLDRYPDSPRADLAAYQRAYTFSVEGKPERALEMLDDVVRQGVSEDVHADAQFARAEALMEMDREPEALVIYKDLRDAYPNHRIVETRIAKIQDRERQRLAVITRARTEAR